MGAIFTRKEAKRIYELWMIDKKVIDRKNQLLREAIEMLAMAECALAPEMKYAKREIPLFICRIRAEFDDHPHV